MALLLHVNFADFSITDFFVSLAPFDGVHVVIRPHVLVPMALLCSANKRLPMSEHMSCACSK